MRTQLPQQLTNADEVSAFISALIANDEMFHLDDDASEIIDGRTDERLFTDEEADKINELMQQAFNICEVWNLPVVEAYVSAACDSDVEPSTFSWDDGNLSFAGWHNTEERWNGWARPYFALDQARAITEHINGNESPTQFAWDGDRLLWKEEDGDWDEIHCTTLRINGDEVKTWPIGSGYWTWSAVNDFDEDDVVNFDDVATHVTLQSSFIVDGHKCTLREFIHANTEQDGQIDAYDIARLFALPVNQEMTIGTVNVKRI